MTDKKQLQKSKRVLADHIKIGKQYVPPMSQFPWKDVRWMGHVLPELLWLGLLNNYYDWQEGAALSLSLARTATQVTGVNPKEFKKKFGKSPKQWFAAASSYSSLTVEQKAQLLAALKAAHQLLPITKALSSLAFFYPSCPLNFLFAESISKQSNKQLNDFKNVLSAHFDKDETPATRMMTNAVYIAFCTNKLRVIASDNRDSPEDSSLTNFPAVENYPHTEESRVVAASVRGTVYTLFDETSSTWGDYFWNRGLELESCDYDGVVNSDE